MDCGRDGCVEAALLMQDDNVNKTPAIRISSMFLGRPRRDLRFDLLARCLWPVFASRIRHSMLLP